jgi:hypothetical protein
MLPQLRAMFASSYLRRTYRLDTLVSSSPHDNWSHVSGYAIVLVSVRLPVYEVEQDIWLLLHVHGAKGLVIGVFDAHDCAKDLSSVFSRLKL